MGISGEICPINAYIQSRQIVKDMYIARDEVDILMIPFKTEIDEHALVGT